MYKENQSTLTFIYVMQRFSIFSEIEKKIVGTTNRNVVNINAIAMIYTSVLQSFYHRTQ